MSHTFAHSRKRGGGNISVVGGGGPALQVNIHVEGVDKTSQEFREIRREVNGRMRDVMQTVGERRVLPVITSRFPKDSGRMARSLFVKRDRIGVFIGSRLRGGENRAVGWIEFGGKRKADRFRRPGARVILGTLDRMRPVIDREIQDEVLEQFSEAGFEVN